MAIDPTENDTPRSVAAAVAMASTILQACALEGAKERTGQSRGLRLTAMTRPGTIIWTDPSTGEERYSAPGDPMYSTALMLATELIDPDGHRVPWP
ncbi:hypothetical protein [uncultured Thiodictyon sp.]|uniref:hypothetical protein n=1 Tax=uncultured Thiodictyon sp. TaxID=1846217 RepID=UPI0025EDE6D0|nr:hypothetical protein [uncultured Thiodictyon sp.]